MLERDARRRHRGDAGHRQRHRRPGGPRGGLRRHAGRRAADRSIDDGLAELAPRYGELTMPLLLFTSRQDHVVEPAQSEYLAAQYGGPVDHRWLERSYHVATQDFDHDLINVEAVDVRPARSPGPERGPVLAQHPEPVGGPDRARPAVAQRLRADDRPRRRRRRVAVRPPPRGSGTSAPARTPTRSPCGASSPASSAPALYHVITDWERFEDNSGDIIKIWEGGLGIPGGMLAGVARRRLRRRTAGACRSGPG